MFCAKTIKRWILNAAVAWCGAWGAVGGFNTGRGAEGVVVTVDGGSFPGRLHSIDSHWNLHFRTADGRRALAAKDLVRWGTRRDPRRGPVVLLADGSVLQAEVMLIKSDQLVVESDLFGRFELPLAAVRGVIFQFSSDPAAADRRFEKIAHSKARQDLLYLTNGEQVVGSLTPTAGPTNNQQGPLQMFLVETDDGRAFIPADRVSAVSFNPALVREPKAKAMHVTVGFRNGAWLHVAELEEHARQTSLVLRGGVRLEATSQLLFEELTFLQPTGGRAVYLSDLPPVSYKHIPFFNQTWKFGRNENLFGGPLRVRSERFGKGISMHSTSRLAFRIPRGAAVFDAQLAIDDTAQGGGSVRFRVYLLDAGAAWRMAAESPIVRGANTAAGRTAKGREKPTVSLHVELDGSRALALIVEFADQGDRQDHADWLDARFTLPP